MGLTKVKVNDVWVKTPEFRAWQHIKDRCLNPNSARYEYYGGRGIGIYPGWVDNFPAFLSHVGERPSGDFSIDRIDNEGDYTPGNLRWATKRQQMLNRRPFSDKIRRDSKGRFTK